MSTPLCPSAMVKIAVAAREDKDGEDVNKTRPNRQCEALAQPNQLLPRPPTQLSQFSLRLLLPLPQTPRSPISLLCCSKHYLCHWCFYYCTYWRHKHLRRCCRPFTFLRLQLQQNNTPRKRDQRTLTQSLQSFTLLGVLRHPISLYLLIHSTSTCYDNN